MKTTSEMQLASIEKLMPYVNNARTHSPEQINKLRSSIREFGFINPVIIDRDFGVIAGHGRILVAKEEKIETVPCVFANHLTEAQKKAYIIADNRMAMGMRAGMRNSCEWKSKRCRLRLLTFRLRALTKRNYQSYLMTVLKQRKMTLMSTVNCQNLSFLGLEIFGGLEGIGSSAVILRKRKPMKFLCRERKQIW